MSSEHGKVFVGSFLLVCFAGAIVWQWQSQESNTQGTAEIRVEHGSPAAISLSLSKGTDIQYIELGNGNKEAIDVTVPETWERKEVRRVPLNAVTKDPPAMGFTRWHLPAFALVSFRTTSFWKQLLVYNQSTLPLKINLTKVDLATHKLTNDVMLLKDEPLVIP